MFLGQSIRPRNLCRKILVGKRKGSEWSDKYDEIRGEEARMKNLT